MNIPAGSLMRGSTRLKRADLWGLLLLAFVVRAGMAVWAELQIPDPFRWNLDTWEYMAMMLAIEEGDWGFYMFILRPPGLPLALVTLKMLAGISAPAMVVWFPIQVAFTSMAVALGAQLVFLLTHQRRLALVTGIVLAIHPVFLAADVPLVSEALFNMLLIVGQVFFVRWLKSQRWHEFLICALALQWMVLTRATAQYYVAVLFFAAMAYNRHLWRRGLLLVVLFSFPILVWIARNDHYTHIATYSTNSTYSMLFYKLVSTENLITGDDPDDIAWEFGSEIERRLTGNPAARPSVFPVGNYDYLYPQNAERYQIMADLRTEKLLETHAWNLVKFPVHLFKNFGRNYALEKLHPIWRWVSPGVALVSFAFFGLGMLKWLRSSRPLWQSLFVLGTTAYFMLGSTVFMGIPDARLGSSTGVWWAFFIALGSVDAYDWTVRMLRLTRRKPGVTVE